MAGQCVIFHQIGKTSKSEAKFLGTSALRSDHQNKLQLSRNFAHGLFHTFLVSTEYERNAYLSWSDYGWD